jgi:hypothetical protein
MAPSAAICITSWQPFADGVGLGGRHSRAGCFPRGEKERAPQLSCAFATSSRAIGTNGSCPDASVGSARPHDDAGPAKQRALPRHNGGSLCRGLCDLAFKACRAAPGGAPRVEMRQRAKTAAPVVLDDSQSLHRCWHNCWHNRERRLAAEKFGGEARGSRLHRRCLGRRRGPQSGDCRLLGSNGCAAHFSGRRAATRECGTCDGHAEGCHEQDLDVFRHDHLLGLSLT